MLSQFEMIRRLKALPKDRKVKISADNTHAWMICQFHFREGTQRESTPSFKVNVSRIGKFASGTGRCFSCGKYIGKFEAILDPLKDNTQHEEDEDTDNYVQTLYNNTLDPILLDKDYEDIILPNPIPWSSDTWRDISATLMKNINAQLIYDEEHDNLMAYLPCIVENIHVGGIRANLEKKGKRNYFNLPGIWVKENGLFPYDYTVAFMRKRNYKTMVLVEGPRDALRCLDLGIPAVAILGTGNYSETKTELLLSLDLVSVITAMDGDKAGRKVTKQIHSSLKNEMNIYNFDFSKYGEDIDPGNCPLKIMKKLKGFIT